MKHTLTLTQAEFTSLRVGAMFGKFCYDFVREYGTDQVTITTPTEQDNKHMCCQLEKLIDFGATSALEVFGLCTFTGLKIRRLA